MEMGAGCSPGVRASPRAPSQRGRGGGDGGTPAPLTTGGVGLGGNLLEHNFTEAPAQPLSGSEVPTPSGSRWCRYPRLWVHGVGPPRVGVCWAGLSGSTWPRCRDVRPGRGRGSWSGPRAPLGPAVLVGARSTPCVSPGLVAACVHAGLGTSRAVLGMEPRLWLPPRRLLALTEKDLQRAVQKRFLLVVSPAWSSGVPCSGNVEAEAGSALSRLTALPWPLPMNFAVNLKQQ